MEVAKFIIETLQKKSNLDLEVENLSDLNYVERGYVDSLGIIKFIYEIEDKFNIQFSDEELSSPSFQIVGELIELVEKKLEAGD